MKNDVTGNAKADIGMRNIIFLGLVSFFADISSEMVYPLIPVYLTVTFGATPALVGVIEGIAESMASLLKVFSGYISDKYKHKKALAFVGYSTGVVYKLGLLLATSWVGVLGARVIDRLGKGIRTAPRDVMIAESAGTDQMGKAFGVHKALDMAGASIGILLAFFLLKIAGDSGYRLIFIFSLIPAVLSLLMFYFIQEEIDSQKLKPRERFWEKIGQLDGDLKRYLMVTFLFALGNSSNTFLLLRAAHLGYSSADTILLYFAYSTTASIGAIPLGKLSDKIERKYLLVAGYVIFAMVYLGFAFATSKITIAMVFLLYGIYTAMTAGVERAFIAEIAPIALKGTMLGLQSTLVGIALFPASVIAGYLWDGVNASAPFVFGAVLALMAALLLAFGLKKKTVKPISDNQ